MAEKPILNIKSLKEQVYDYLREKLRSGEILPGSAINLDETSRKLGVSRTPLRDALLQLESDDFDLYYEKNLALHDVDLTLCGNENLVRIVRAMKRRLYDFPRQRGFIKEWELASIAEHIELLQLLKLRKAAEAAAYIRDIHWSYEVQERYINRYYALESSVPGQT